MSVCDSGHCVVVVFEIGPGDPLLAVECQRDLDRIRLDLRNFFFCQLFAAPKPRKRRNDALEAFLLSIPIGRDFSFSLCANEFDSLDGRVVDALADDENRGPKN